MSENIFLLGSIVSLAAKETDTDLLDLIFKLLAINETD